jgi:hypothetical protein
MIRPVRAGAFLHCRPIVLAVLKVDDALLAKGNGRLYCRRGVSASNALGRLQNVDPLRDFSEACQRELQTIALLK